MSMEVYDTAEEYKTTGRKYHDVKNRIIAAALKEFAEYGPDGARVKHIAEQAGVSKSSIFYYFETKDDLYRSVIKEFLRMINSQLDLRISRSVTLEQMLREIIYTHMNIMRQSPDLVKLMRGEIANPRKEFLEDIAEATLSSSVRALIHDKFKSEIRAGNLRDVDIQQAMISFNAMSLGYILMAPMIEMIWNIEDIDEFLARRKYAVVDLFLNGIKAK